jgi:hypothetical protein
MNGPTAVTANFRVRTTFTSSVAVQLTITGSGCAAGTYTTPATVSMTSGAVCSVNFPGTQTSAGCDRIQPLVRRRLRIPRTITATVPGNLLARMEHPSTCLRG